VLFELLGGLVMEQRLIAFLERLLGEPVDPAGRIAVSSTQRAQIVAWLNAQGITADFNRFKANLMSVQEMLAGGSEATSSAAPAPRPAIPPLRPVAPVVAGAAPLGLGVDLQARTSMPEASDYRADPFYSTNFSARELAHCIGQGDPLESLTGLWAAKEAVIKAGAASPVKPGVLGDIEIVHAASGAPSYPGCLISISHEAGMAVAVCVRLS
jgi:phosphopantetheine--protein transferase-like protein